MKESFELAKLFPPNALTRDLVYLASGICALTGLFLFYSLNLSNFPLLTSISTTERILIFISFAYIFARILKEIGESVMDFVRFIVSRSKKETFVGKWETLVNDSSDHLIELYESATEIPQAELDEFIAKKTGAALNHERMVEAEIFVQIALGLSLSLLIFDFHYITLLVALLILGKAVHIRIYLLEWDAEFKALLKKSNKPDVPN